MSVGRIPSLSYFHSLIESHTGNYNSSLISFIFRQLLRCDLNPNEVTFTLLIKACASTSSYVNAIREANQIQTHLAKRGFIRFLYVSTALADMYMKLGHVSNARLVFEDMTNRDVASWNTLICGYSRNGHHVDALELFVQMQRAYFWPSPATIVSLVPSCGWDDLIVQGRVIHGLGVKTGLCCNLQVMNVLTSMYARCKDLEASKLLFDEMDNKNAVSWNTIIGGYGKNRFFEKALFFFKRMIQEGYQPNSVTMVNLLSSDVDPHSIQGYIVKSGLINDPSVVTSLVCTYSKFGRTDMAELLYESVPHNNLISLTAILSSFAEKGDVERMLQCFAQMQHLDLKLDAVSLIGILHGLNDPVQFSIGQAFHGFGLKSGLNSDCLVANGLISMYAKFDDVETSLYLFSEMNEKPASTWNSLISGCVLAGKSSNALALFSQMRTSRQKPDSITIVSLLSGCCQLGYLEFGKRLHNYVLRNNIEVEGSVGTAFVDMYGKCGKVEWAESLFKTIRHPCLATWNAMMSCYSLYGLEHEALACYDEMQKQGIKPNQISFLGVLAACTHGGLVHEGGLLFRVMMEFGIVPGLQHYACMVGLLGRAGLFKEAVEFIQNMELEPDSSVWGALLSSCCVHEEIRLAECLANRMFCTDFRNSGLYISMSNLYATIGRWDDVARVRDMMMHIGGDGCSGISVVEVISSEDMTKKNELR